MGKEQELLEAARVGNLSVIERIFNSKKSGQLLASLRRGTSVNFQDSSGYTALHHAVLNGHRDVAAALLTNGASVNLADFKGATPLHLAAWTGDEGVVQMLLQHSPDVNASSEHFETPLHSAAQYGHSEVVRLLLQNDADPLIRNGNGELPLDLACLYGRSAAVRELLKASPPPNLTGHHPSPLHLAARNGHSTVVELLLEAGFPINTLTNAGSALHEAAITGKVEIAKLLLDYGIDTELKDCHTRTVTDLLKEFHNERSFRILTLIQESPCCMSSSQSLVCRPSRLPELVRTPQLDHRPSSLSRPSKPPRNSPLSKSSPSIALPQQSNGSQDTSLAGSFDENAEWEEIADIMASCDQQLEVSGGVERWLVGLGLQRYLPIFLLHGFDDIAFLHAALDRTDLELMGVTDSSHQTALLHAAARLPPPPAPDLSSLQAWLRSLRLPQYQEAFAHHGHRPSARVPPLWEVELSSVLGIYKLGHRKRLLASLPPPGDSYPPVDLDKLSFDVEEFGGGEEEELWLRPPTHLLSGSLGSVPRCQWRHPPQNLMFRSCDYRVRYLGSSLVKELRGVESTRRAIARQRTARPHLNQVQPLTLSISCSGVRILDPKTHTAVCEHKIRNIHCVGQDPEHMNYFAYITKDGRHRHFCHVFGVTSLELASEIILTLGEAFEVAYQLALQRGSSSS